MFSIIMPAYNSENFIKKAINSVLSQTFSDFELIVVDDGSTDQTCAICEEFSYRDQRIKLVKAPHGGVSAARNLGIKSAKYENIVFLDSDDEWDCNLLQSCVEYMSNEDEIFVFGIRSDYYSLDGKFQYSKNGLSETGKVEQLHIDNTILHYFTSDVLLAPYNKIFKRKILLMHNIYFNQNCVYLEDLKFNLDYLSHINKIKLLNKNLYYYRLILKEKQILKRAFKGLFKNADELYHSCEALSKSKDWGFPENSIFVSLLIKAYLNELLCHIYEKNDRVQKTILDTLNKNENYNKLLSFSKGKFFMLLTVLKKFRLKRFQIFIIKRRYW